MQGGGIQINDIHKAPYFPANKTYDVTSLTQGPYYEILKQMEKKLNFTTRLYKRKKRGWGIPIQYPNGTIYVKGIYNRLAHLSHPDSYQ